MLAAYLWRITACYLTQFDYLVYRNEFAETEVKELYSINQSAPGYLLYQASKVQAERAFWSYQQQDPSFDMISLCPA